MAGMSPGKIVKRIVLLAGLPGCLALTACEPDQSSGETLLNACLQDQARDDASYACNCYVAAINEDLSYDDLNFYGAMARHGYYADRERLQSVFEDEEYGVFERAANRCNLALFDSGPRLSTPSPDPAPPPPPPPQATGSGPSILPGAQGLPAAHGPGYPPPQNTRGWDDFPDEPWPFQRDMEGLYPICLSDFDYQEYCVTRETAARLYNDGSRYWLLRGDAELAALDLRRGVVQTRRDTGGGDPYYANDYFRPRGDAMRRVMNYWTRAIEWGRPFGAQSALMAQRRLQAHMVQCEPSADGSSLARIARTAPGVVGDVISLELRQAALSALGYYAGDVDGHYGPATRDAARGFQRELGYDETGSLTPRQTSLLICHAAQTARDPHLQNALGIMYATGLGVERNTDLSLEWFETAARREDPDAYFNLSLIFGTGAVLGSYRLCGVVENPERADAYLRDAARLGHPVAERWRASREFNAQPNARERWSLISERLHQAAARNGGDFYLDWRRRIDFDVLGDASPACLGTD